MEGSAATYADAYGNEQATNQGFEYLIKFTITHQNSGHVNGKIEMWHQNNKYDLACLGTHADVSVKYFYNNILIGIVPI